MKKTIFLFALAFMAFLGAKAQLPCNANFTYVVSPSGIVTFTGTPSAPSATYTWFFGNGTSGSGMNTTAFYNAPGSYTVCLIVQDSSVLSPCIDSNCVTITIGSSTGGCQANFYAYPDSLGAMYQYSVNNMSTGSPLSYIWNWGDGSAFSNGPNPTHIYPGPGTYNLCLYIDNGAGCLDTFCQTITVNSVSFCDAQFSMTPDNSPSALPFTFNTVNSSTGTGLTYTWVWGDGSPNSTGLNPSHVYPAAGTYTACLFISNSSGCSDSSCITVTATTGSTGCMASFAIAPDTSFGAPAHTYIGYNTSTGTGLQYLWTWGDGTSSTGAYPSHTYAAAGNYTICLVVSGTGCVDSFCMTTYLAKTEAMVTVNFQAPSGLNDIVKGQAGIYPNPADKELYIMGDKAMTYSVEIYNLNGMRVLSTTAKGNEKINILSLPANYYMVRIADREGKQQFAKFMKK